MRTNIKFLFFVLILAFVFSAQTLAQKTSATPAKLPKVTQIDEIKLKSLIKPNDKPLLVSFWATWCDPCREEFPDLVKIGADFKGKIDFITISLDDLAEINRDVPKFLADMKAEMPGYLLKSQNEDAAIMSVSKDWQGGLPFTILFDAKGATAYFKQGKVKTEDLRQEIEKLVAPSTSKATETKTVPKVAAIDEINLGKLIQTSKDKKQPLLIKFWATWCKPCREEFPAFIAIYNEFQPKGVEIITVSTDSTEELKKVSPFLQEMNAEMPAFLLHVKNKNRMFSLMPFWTGGLPFLVLYDTNGKVSYAKTGAVDSQILKSRIENALSSVAIQ
ncbi:MAG TPA: redoxin domain-containing protein [Pyrinomonadaceae bacterium]|jgi:thiol-disulfide isomerase/thioredoxin